MLSLFSSALCVFFVFQSVVSIPLDSIDTIFSFGDSYTSTGYDPRLGVLSIDNTLTASGGQSWIKLFAARTPARTSYFNLAAPNSSIASSVVLRSSGRDFPGQVELFRTYFNETEGEVKWDSASTLFTVWFGADDILNAVARDQDLISLAPSILTAYDAQIAALYEVGARHFLLLSIPSIAAAPLAIAQNATAPISAAVDFFNARIEFYVGIIAARFPGAEASYYDAKGLMDKVLSDPTSYGFLNKTNSCEGYASAINQPLLNLSSECGPALAQYFWRDRTHPTWPVHQLIADGIVELPGSSPTNPTPTTPTSAGSFSTSAPSSAGGSSFHLPSFSPSSSVINTTRSSNTSARYPASAAAAEATTLTGTFILSGSHVLIIGPNSTTSTIPLPAVTSSSNPSELSSPYFTPSSSLPSSSLSADPTPTPTPAPSLSTDRSSSEEERRRTTTTAGRVRVGTNTSGASPRWERRKRWLGLSLALGVGVGWVTGGGGG